MKVLFSFEKQNPTQNEGVAIVLVDGSFEKFPIEWESGDDVGQIVRNLANELDGQSCGYNYHGTRSQTEEVEVIERDGEYFRSDQLDPLSSAEVSYLSLMGQINEGEY